MEMGPSAPTGGVVGQCMVGQGREMKWELPEGNVRLCEKGKGGESEGRSYGYKIHQKQRTQLRK